MLEGSAKGRSMGRLDQATRQDPWYGIKSCVSENRQSQEVMHGKRRRRRAEFLDRLAFWNLVRQSLVIR